MCVGARCSSVVYRDVVIPCVPTDGKNKSRERRRKRGKCFVYGFIASQGGFTILRLGPAVGVFVCLLEVFGCVAGARKRVCVFLMLMFLVMCAVCPQ